MPDGYDLSLTDAMAMAVTARREAEQATGVIAALVARLGGDVELSDMDLAAVDTLLLHSQATSGGIRLALGQPVTPAAAAAAATPPPGYVQIIVHEPGCPNPEGGCGHCQCDVAGLAPAGDPREIPAGMPIAPSVPPPGSYPGPVTLDGDNITRPWRYL
jgi:hypothetical protein